MINAKVAYSKRSGGGERVKSYAVSPKATRGEKTLNFSLVNFFGACALLMILTPGIGLEKSYKNSKITLLLQN